MPSPFPGMNPYLEHEDAWHNFHEQFPDRVVEILEPQVGPHYFLKVDEHVYIHELPDEQRRAVDKVGMSYVEIRDRRSRRLVTVIELLSPSNKRPGDDREQYEYKRAELLASSTHLVEIDLLRGGQRMPFDEPVECDYCILVSRSHERRKADLWTLSLRDVLPTISIPLARGHPEPKLDLQAVLNHLYDTRGYEKFIYDTPPDPPLPAKDADWARAFLAKLAS
jgi:hypothetical protein